MTTGSGTVYWEFSDGTRAIEIMEAPAFVCSKCEMVYQTGEVTKEIENQLFLVDTKKIGSSIVLRS